MHSAPPASATSTVERRIARYASPIAWADEVHAVWIVAVGPSIPKMPASREARYWGHVRYDRSRPTRRANSLTNPDGVTRPSSDRLAYAIAPSSRRSWRSPLVPTNTPARGDARTALAPAATTAPRAARTPTTVPRGSSASNSASARNSSISAGSASAAAIWVGRPSGSKWLIRRTPDTPASAAFQKASRSNPIGVTTPRPVTTTRRRAPTSGEERVATVHRQDLALNTLRRRARQEEHHVGDRLGSHQPPSRRPRADRLERLRAVGNHVPDVGLDGAGRDRVHGDPLPTELDGEIAGERLERGLRDPDRDIAGDHALAPEARERDDPPAGRHERRGFLGEEEERARVGREHPVPLLRRQLEAVLEHTRGGVADEDVEPPGDALDLRHQPLDLGGLLQVGRNEVGHAAAQLDVTRRARSGLAVDEEAHEDARAGLGEAERDGAPDPAPASRDQDLALRAHGAAPRAASSSGDRWSSRASAPSRAALAAASVPGCAASSAYSSVAVATRRPSTSAVAASTHGSADERSSQRTLSWSPGRTTWRNEARASRPRRPTRVQS